MSEARVVISTDGYVSSQGEAAWAFVARWDGREVVARGAIPGSCPSHLAEWWACARALAWAEGQLAAGQRLELRTDSVLVEKGLRARQPAMSGVAAELRASCRQAIARLAARGIPCVVSRVTREENAEADALARDFRS